MSILNYFKQLLKSSLVIGLFLLLVQPIFGQQHKEVKNAFLKTAVVLLEEQGFQNISIASKKNDLYISYENRAYRFEPTAIKQILKTLYPTLKSNIETLILIPKIRNTPLISIKIPVNEYDQFVKNRSLSYSLAASISASYDVVFPNIRKIDKSKISENFGVELVLEPQLRMGLGGFPDPFTHQINFIPAVHLHLWTGAKFTFQGIIPISNQFNIPEQEIIRPRLITLNQLIRLPSNSFVELSLGYFTKKRFGGDIKLGKFFWNDRFFLKGEIGFTGYASYPKIISAVDPERGWEFADIGYLNYTGGFDVRFPKWNLTVGMEIGKVLFNEEVVSVKIGRQFGEFELDFFAFKSKKGENYGFNVGIPLFPKKYLKRKRFSIRPARKFRFGYQASRTFVQQQLTGSEIFETTNTFSPSFILNQLAKETGW